MKRLLLSATFVLTAVLPSCVSSLAIAQTPIGSEWWPSEFGSGDERGAINRLNPGKVLEANQLVTAGKVYQLGRVYEQGMPVPGKRHYSLTIPGLPTYPAKPHEKNQGVANDELMSGEIGQVGTQFDGLGHVGVHHNGKDLFYNGFDLKNFGSPYGLRKLGIEKVGIFYTRGVLLDVARARGIRRLQGGNSITADDLQAALKMSGAEIREGDAVFLHTGHGQLWMVDNDQYGIAEPGINMDAAKWLTDKKICLVGADTWAIEVVPPEDPLRPYPVHQWNLVRHGVYHLENLDLTDLAADQVYEFAFIFCPLRLKGATGSPGNPIAVK